MNKFLKIGGIAVLTLIVAVNIFAFFSRLISGSDVGLKTKKTSLSVPSRMNDYSNEAVTSMDVAGSLRSEKMIAPTEPAPYQAGDLPELDQLEKKIIKDGNLNLKVENADKASTLIAEIAKNNGGEVAASNFNQLSENVKSGTVTVRVPVANFEKAFGEIKKTASLVISESISGQDATAQYVDLQAQLRNRQAEEQSFMRILEQAQKIDDVLAVTRELARVRGNIEQLQGQIKFLESQTDMSTISVNLTEDANITIVDSWRPLQIVKEALNSLVKGLQDFVDSAIKFFIVVIPFLFIWAVIGWLLYKAGKKIYLKIKE